MRLHGQPYLTKQQEQTASADMLVLSHGRLVAKIAKSFARYGVDEDDLIQEGNIGLIIAASKFDPSKGFRFSTYAQFWVRQMMREHVMKDRSVVYRPKPHGAGLSDYFKRRGHRDVSLAAPVGDEGLTVADTFVSPDPGPDEIVEMELDGQAFRARLDGVLDGMKEREALVIRMRYLRDEKATLDDVGRVLGVSRERVRQIEANALEKLRKELAA